MSRLPPSQRARHGAMEGAGIGLAVSLLRAGLTFYRKGLPDDPVAMLPELLSYVAVFVVICSYVFAVGRAVADGLAGALLGGAVLAVAGAFGGSLIPFDATATPYPILMGAALGAFAGAPIGAFVQRTLTRKPPMEKS